LLFKSDVLLVEIDSLSLVLRDDDRRLLLWQRGEHDTHRSYDINTIGMVETPKDN
jgi:hypothetical protein